MPHRPSKKPKARPPQKTGPGKDINLSDKASQLRHRDNSTKAILGKFQGRKSI